MKWFRFYSSVLHDPKVQKLHPCTFKHWINILCIASDNKERGSLPGVEEISYALRLKPAEVTELLSKLEEKKLIDRTETGSFMIHNWTGRQRNSDDVSERVRKHRGERTSGSFTTPDQMATKPPHTVKNNERENNDMPENVTLLERTVDTEENIDNKKTIKPIAPKPRKAPSGDHQLFIAYWQYAYKLARGEDAFLSGADQKAIEAMLKQLKIERVILCAAYFLTSRDLWLNDKKTVSVLQTKIGGMPNGKTMDLEKLREEFFIPPEGTKLPDWKFWEEHGN